MGDGSGLLERVKDSAKSVFSRLNPVPSRPEVGVGAEERFGTESLSVKISGEPLTKYPVGQAQVVIHRDGDEAYYEVSEPSLDEDERQVYRDLLENFYYSLEPEAAESPTEYLEGSIWDSAYELGLLDEVRESFSKYRYFLERDAFGFGKLHAPVRDDRIEEISVSGPGDIARVIHRDYTELGWLKTNIRFESDAELRGYNERTAQRFGENLTAAVPVVDATTSRGDRISMTFGDEVTQAGSSLTLRKRPEEPLTLAFLVANGTISSTMGAYFWQELEWRGFLEVMGPIGSGKTTLMNAVLASVDPSMKRTTIEETLEIRLPEENWQSFHTREVGPTMGEEYEYGLFDLVKTAMRHRPDYLAVGEVRGEEVQAMVHAASLGHSCVSTLHADSAEHALTRLRTPPMDLDPGEILLMWSMALMRRIRLPTGRVVRRCASVHELTPGEGEDIQLEKIFEYSHEDDEFSPESVEEVLRKSERFRSALDTRAETEREAISLLKEKKDLLEKLAERDETGFETFTEKIREYYRRR